MLACAMCALMPPKLSPKKAAQHTKPLLTWPGMWTSSSAWWSMPTKPNKFCGSLFIMCSTVDPNWSVTLEKRLNDMGLLYLDAPISGGAAKAASGQMTMMTSGQASAYAKAGNALESMAANVYKLGDRAGYGSKVKIINQLLAGVHIAAAAEAMALGLREGVAADALYEVITNSAGNSWMFENRMAHVIKGDYTPLSAVDIFVKDLGLVLDTARATKFPLPLSATAHQMFMQASTAGHGREDDSAVIKIFPGIELPHTN
jgi:L-threonate 2-dehydrogenase